MQWQQTALCTSAADVCPICMQARHRCHDCLRGRCSILDHTVLVLWSSHGVALTMSSCGPGEYGHLLKDPTLREQFALLQLRFPSATTEIKASLLSAYLKMQVTPVLHLGSHCVNPSLALASVTHVSQPVACCVATIGCHDPHAVQNEGCTLASSSLEIESCDAGGGERVGPGACQGHPGGVYQVKVLSRLTDAVSMSGGCQSARRDSFAAQARMMYCRHARCQRRKLHHWPMALTQTALSAI